MTRGELIEERPTHAVIGAFYEVYNTLGFGYHESIYAAAMSVELRLRGHRVDREVRVTVMYKGVELATQRIDMLVDGQVVVETKATIELHRSGARQLYSYLRATRREVGLLLHFGPDPAFRRILYRPAARASPTTETDRADPSDLADPVRPHGSPHAPRVRATVIRQIFWWIANRIRRIRSIRSMSLLRPAPNDRAA